ARTVEEDAGVVDEPSAPVGLAVVGADLLGDALLAADRGELPQIVGDVGDEALDGLAVGTIGEVRAVGAAPLHELGRGLRVHTLAARTEDAVPRRAQEGHVDLPRAPVLARVLEHDPLARRTPCALLR